MHRPWLRLVLGLLAAFGVIALAACGDDDDGVSGWEVFRVNLGSDPTTLDPAKAVDGADLAVIDALFRGPFRFDSNLDLVPDLAAELPTKANGGISPDGTVYTIRFRDRLEWSDGRPLTGEDFAYALRRALDPRTGADYRSYLSEIRGAAVLDELAGKLAEGDIEPSDPAFDAAIAGLGIVVKDARTAEITLSQPSPLFLKDLGLWIAYPVRRDIIEAHGDRWTDPEHIVSSGPFVLKRWQRGDHVLLEPNLRYDSGRARIAVRLEMIGDPAQALNAYRAGELDQVSIPAPLVPTVKGDATLAGELVSVDRLATVRVTLANTRAPFNNGKLRQALAWAVDRKALVEVALRGAGKGATSFIPPGIAGHDPNATPGFDAARARTLLAEAGYPQGRGLPPVRLTYANAGDNPAIATYLKEQWNTVLGVDITLEPVEPAAFGGIIRSGQWQMIFLTWGADYPDPDSFLTPNYRTGGPANLAGYSNPAFDALVDRAGEETDRDAATALYREAQAIMQADSPDIFLLYRQSFALRKPYVTGMVATGMDFQFVGDRSLASARISR
jgi:oligopeptide transport system substrate-binding protein